MDFLVAVLISVTMLLLIVVREMRLAMVERKRRAHFKVRDLVRQRNYYKRAAGAWYESWQDKKAELDEHISEGDWWKQ